MRARIVLFAGLGLFTVALAYLIASSLTRRAAPVFEATLPGEPAEPEDGVFTLTVDARAQDGWTHVDLDRAVVLPPGDSAGWDLAAQRFRLRAARSVVRIGTPDAPPALAVGAGTAGPGNREVGRWYVYGALSHLLQPAGHTYAVRTMEGRTALVEIASYYCPGLQAGCVTLRYRIAP